eukprot:6865423-Prymnesium_polylepis.1
MLDAIRLGHTKVYTVCHKIGCGLVHSFASIVNQRGRTRPSRPPHAIVLRHVSASGKQCTAVGERFGRAAHSCVPGPHPGLSPSRVPGAGAARGTRRRRAETG